MQWIQTKMALPAPSRAADRLISPMARGKEPLDEGTESEVVLCAMPDGEHRFGYVDEVTVYDETKPYGWYNERGEKNAEYVDPTEILPRPRRFHWLNRTEMKDQPVAWAYLSRCPEALLK